MNCMFECVPGKGAECSMGICVFSGVHQRVLPWQEISPFEGAEFNVPLHSVQAGNSAS